MSTGYLLLETGSHVLTEAGGTLVLEDFVASSPDLYPVTATIRERAHTASHAEAFTVTFREQAHTLTVDEMGHMVTVHDRFHTATHDESAHTATHRET